MSKKQEIGLISVFAIAAILISGFVITQYRDAQAAAVRSENLIFTMVAGEADSIYGGVTGIGTNDELRGLYRLPGAATVDSVDKAVNLLSYASIVGPDSIRINYPNTMITTGATILVVFREKTF